MFILTIEGKEKEGAYAVPDKKGGQILYIFEEEDDADRYAMMLEDEGYPDMNVLEVDEELMIKLVIFTGTNMQLLLKMTL